MQVTRAGIVFMVLFLGSGLTQRVGKFWHVSDYHYDPSYWTDQLSCNDVVPNPGQYGDYWCDSPWLLVQDSIDNMARIDKNVDFILWTGDTVAHIKDENTSLALNMEILQNISTALTNAFPNVPVYATLGNHDFYPTDQAEPQESKVYRQVADMWGDWIANQSQVQLFTEGGYYMAMVQPKIRLLALNTNFYYTSNDLTADIDDPAGQMAWMEDQLKVARANGEKVFLIAHVPFGLLTPDLVDWLYPRHRARLLPLVLQYSDVIAATHFGHDHSDGFKILQKDDGTSGIAQFTAPSITPWRYRIPNKTGKPHNPGMRLVKYDQDTAASLDYDQYYINLTDSNTAGQTNWEKLYTFIEAYDVDDMSVASLRKIFSRMEKGGGKAYASKFCKFALVSSQEKECTEEMRAGIYCGGLQHDLTKAQECSEQYIKDINAGHRLYINPLITTLPLMASVLRNLF